MDNSEDRSSTVIWSTLATVVALGLVAYGVKRWLSAHGDTETNLDDIFGKCESLANTLESQLRAS